MLRTDVVDPTLRTENRDAAERMLNADANVPMPTKLRALSVAKILVLLCQFSLHRRLISDVLADLVALDALVVASEFELDLCDLVTILLVCC